MQTDQRLPVKESAAASSVPYKQQTQERSNLPPSKGKKEVEIAASTGVEAASAAPPEEIDSLGKQVTPTPMRKSRIAL